MQRVSVGDTVQVDTHSARFIAEVHQVGPGGEPLKFKDRNGTILKASEVFCWFRHSDR